MKGSEAFAVQIYMSGWGWTTQSTQGTPEFFLDLETARRCLELDLRIRHLDAAAIDVEDRSDISDYRITDGENVWVPEWGANHSSIRLERSKPDIENGSLESRWLHTGRTTARHIIGRAA